MNRFLKQVSLILLMCSCTFSFAQTFTRQDTLRGSITPQRAWWDLTHYDLSVAVFPESQSISGTNIMQYTVLEEVDKTLQIDLQSPLVIERVTQNGKDLSWTSEGSAHFISLKAKQKKGSSQKLSITWKGKPKAAENAPWDGGFSWSKDSKGHHFIATSNQGIGSSVWWPNKDHSYDEVDSLDMHITVPKDLVDVSNGRLIGITEQGQTKTYHWTVKNPINNYGINLNIGNYVNFSEVYLGENGPLDMDYWVLEHNLEKAKKQFQQAPMMMRAFEYWFGPYPFYEDSFKLVEAPYLGMEHQSSVTYGNGYANGYRGKDLSGTGEGLKFDFIIIHESGHEWFANNITNKDVADMWIHESFTNYSENLFLDYHYGKKSAAQYVIGTRKNVQNKSTIIGQYDVHSSGSGDMYYKGGNMLHMIRTIVNDDELWRQTLRGLNKDFYHDIVTTQQVEDYLSKHLKVDLSSIFDQYLRTTQIPTFEYRLDKNTLSYRFIDVVDHFKMPLRVALDGVTHTLQTTNEWQEVTIPQDSSIVVIPEDYYIQVEKK